MELGVPAALAQLALGHQRLAGTNGLVMAAHRQHRRHPVLGHRLAQSPVEPGSLRAGERPVGELDERRPSPQRERLIEPSDGDIKVTALGGATALLGEATRPARCRRPRRAGSREGG